MGVSSNRRSLWTTQCVGLKYLTLSLSMWVNHLTATNLRHTHSTLRPVEQVDLLVGSHANGLVGPVTDENGACATQHRCWDAFCSLPVGSRKTNGERDAGLGLGHQKVRNIGLLFQMPRGAYYETYQQHSRCLPGSFCLENRSTRTFVLPRQLRSPRVALPTIGRLT